MNYYNDNDKKTCAWLQELIKANLIPQGVVDNRSIKEVSANDLLGFNQIHFFAGVGGWPLALHLAGYGNRSGVWTGSCPCQPFSTAGKRKGTADERHLWPEFKRLITDGKPSIVFGEQVAAKDGRVWLSGVRSDLEALGYEVGAADLCAAGVGAPHIRQRLYWVANSRCVTTGESGYRFDIGAGASNPSRVGAAQGHGLTNGCGNSGMAHHHLPRLEGHTRYADNRHEPRRIEAQPVRSTATGSCGSWGRYKLIPCGDGKTRRIKPGISPLAHGVPGRVGLLRGYGNAIVPQVAAEFIQAFFDIKGEIKCV